MLCLPFNFRESSEEIKTCCYEHGNLHRPLKTVNTEIFMLNLLFAHHEFIKFCTKIGICFSDYCYDRNIFIVIL